MSSPTCLTCREWRLSGRHSGSAYCCSWPNSAVRLRLLSRGCGRLAVYPEWSPLHRSGARHGHPMATAPRGTSGESGEPADRRGGRGRRGCAGGVETWKSGILGTCGAAARGRFPDFQVFTAPAPRWRPSGGVKTPARWGDDSGGFICAETPCSEGTKVPDRHGRRLRNGYQPGPAGICVLKSRGTLRRRPRGVRRNFLLATGQG